MQRKKKIFFMYIQDGIKAVLLSTDLKYRFKTSQ